MVKTKANVRDLLTEVDPEVRVVHTGHTPLLTPRLLERASGFNAAFVQMLSCEKNGFELTRLSTQILSTGCRRRRRYAEVQRIIEDAVTGGAAYSTIHGRAYSLDLRPVT